MSIMKKIAAVAAAVLLFSTLAGCDGSVKVASVEASFDGESISCLAGAMQSNGEKSIPLVSSLIGNEGTVIYSKDLLGGTSLVLTYAGQSKGKYTTGISTENLTNSFLNYLIGNGSTGLVDDLKKDIIPEANISYTEKKGESEVKWTSTTCTINITSQVKGQRGTLISGTFEGNMYYWTDGQKVGPKKISGTISNVPGF